MNGQFIGTANTNELEELQDENNGAGAINGVPGLESNTNENSNEMYTNQPQNQHEEMMLLDDDDDQPGNQGMDMEQQN